MDNAGEFHSDLFTRFCASMGIKIEYTVPYEHAHNAIAQSHIKRVQSITRALLAGSNLPATAWGLAIIHGSNLLNLRPLTGNTKSAYELRHGYAPDISHLRVWGCAVTF